VRAEGLQKRSFVVRYLTLSGGEAGSKLLFQGRASRYGAPGAAAALLIGGVINAIAAGAWEGRSG
jgi:hypothetical protein